MSESPQAKTAGETKVPEQTRGIEEQSKAYEPRRRAEAPPPEPTGWVGWIAFASMMMIMVGSFQVMLGLTALFSSDYFLVGEANLLVSVDYTGWGWTHIALGALAIGAAFGLLAGQMWARVVGIAMAGLSAIVNLAFVAAYPLWSVMVIVLDVLVIYAIAMHGKEAKALV
jgi:hypothetical protein